MATALGAGLARRGHEVHFFSYAQPVRLDLTVPNLHFHLVELAHHTLFPCPDYTLPLAVKMAEIAQVASLDIIHAHYAVPNALAAVLAAEMSGVSPGIVTTLHGTDTTFSARTRLISTAIEYALGSIRRGHGGFGSLREQTQEILQPVDEIEVIPNFFTPRTPAKRATKFARARPEGRISHFHMSNMRPGKRIDLLLQTVAQMATRDRVKLLILAGEPAEPFRRMMEGLGIADRIIVRENEAGVEEFILAADAGLYTSDYESFGLSILETLWFGKPIVAFNVGGIPKSRAKDIRFIHFRMTAALPGRWINWSNRLSEARPWGRRPRPREREFFRGDRARSLRRALPPRARPRPLVVGDLDGCPLDPTL